ncbi:MAG: aspartate ammonia-lyase [Alphaproteobacteria bacterium]|nr:aspartate ammonia-lyase [Alphaproteobacteria bacterium]
MLTTLNTLLQNVPFRAEKDLLGAGNVPAQALFGIHTVRAVQNFPIANRPVHKTLIHAFGYVKGAAARTNRQLGFWANTPVKANAIETACDEMTKGLLDEHIVVDAFQGGAGTSTNMNVNEVLANRALQLMGLPLGTYEQISPLEDINLHQSTNDAYPTALKLAVITQLRQLTDAISQLETAFRAKEKDFARIVKLGRTQLQDAVLITLGREMKTYAEALARDVTRIQNCEKDLCVVNLGGTAIGTGIAAPIDYITQVVGTLREMTNYNFKQADDLVDNTQNADVFVEVSGALKTCAATMIKISNDLRLMASGPDGGFAEIQLPARQAGSSIMPGKVNPVIAEALTQAALRMISYDSSITTAASMGNLELNAFLPLIADSLLDGIQLMTQSMVSMRTYCVEGITANESRCRANIEGSTAILTALVPQIGYSRAVKVVHDAHEQGKTIRQIVLEAHYMNEAAFNEMISPASVMQLGSPEAVAKSL